MAYPTFYTGLVASAVAASKHHLVLWNGHASAKVRIFVVTACPAPQGAVAGVVAALHATKLTRTVPGAGAPAAGTVVPIRAAAPTDALPAGIEARSAPTLTGLTEDAAPFGIGAINPEETVAPIRMALYEVFEPLKAVELAPFEGMTIKQGPLASAGAIHLLVAVAVV